MAVRPGPPDDGRVRTVFLGSGAFAVPALQRLAAHPLGRASSPSSRRRRARPAGRRPGPPTPIAAAATGLDIHPVLTPPRLRHPEAIDAILAPAARPGRARRLRPDRPAAAARPAARRAQPPPVARCRGSAAPPRCPAAILAGDPETAVTLMRMDAGLDTGPIVAQEAGPARRDGARPRPRATPGRARRGPARPVARRLARRLAARRAPGGRGRRAHPAAPPRGRPARSDAAPPRSSSARSAPTSRGPGRSSRSTASGSSSGRRRSRRPRPATRRARSSGTAGSPRSRPPTAASCSTA